jgi:LPXTG-site transpeptidase (sortase) family protein
VLRRTLGLLLVAAAALFLVQASTAPNASPPPSAAGALSSPSSTAAAATAAPTIAAIPPGYRVRVPRLGIDLPIAEGVIERDIDQQLTPEGYAFHLPGTGIPGEGTNTYLYAHARIGMFLSLWNAQVGDDVTITAPDGSVRRYVVSEVRPRVPPTDVSVAQPTPDERLTLQTSTGPNPTDPRFVVIALPRS